jgi:site-specific DNA-adenine methylase
MLMPFVKWTGSKRLLSDEILQYFSENINIYYEPFLGGGSV